MVAFAVVNSFFFLVLTFRIELIKAILLRVCVVFFNSLYIFFIVYFFSRKMCNLEWIGPNLLKSFKNFKQKAQFDSQSWNFCLNLFHIDGVLANESILESTNHIKRICSFDLIFISVFLINWAMNKATRELSNKPDMCAEITGRKMSKNLWCSHTPTHTHTLML